MTVLGVATLQHFAKLHAASRKPLTRFIEIVRAAEWRHLPEVKRTFPAVDYAAATGTMIFDIGGNKYRLIARVDFKEQILFIQDVWTHEQYDREDL